MDRTTKTDTRFEWISGAGEPSGKEYDELVLSHDMKITVTYPYAPTHPELATVRLCVNGDCVLKKEGIRANGREDARKKAVDIVTEIMERRSLNAERAVFFLKGAKEALYPYDVVSQRKAAEA